MAYTGIIKREEEDESKTNEGAYNAESGEALQPVEIFEEMPAEVQEESKEEEAKEKLGILYEERDKIRKLLYGAEGEIRNNKEAVRDISDKTGITVKGGKMIKISESARGEFARQERLAESEIADLEKDALGAPSGIEEEKKPKKFNDYKAEVEEVEIELKKDRGDFVKKFIEESVGGALDHFEPDFKQAENNELAEDFVGFKIKKEIELAARRFVEEGGRPDFGFLATLEISSFEDEKENEVKYITGFSVKILGSESKVRDVDVHGGASLVLGKDRRKIWDVKRSEAGVKKEKKR